MLGRKASYLFGRRSSSNKTKTKTIAGLTISAPTPTHPININGSYIDLAVNRGEPSPREEEWASSPASSSRERGRIKTPWDNKELEHDDGQLLQRPPPRWQSLGDGSHSPARSEGMPSRSPRPLPSPAAASTSGVSERREHPRSLNFSRKIITPDDDDDDGDGDDDGRGRGRNRHHRHSSLSVATPQELRKLRRVSSVPAGERPLSAASSPPASRGGPHAPLAGGLNVNEPRGRAARASASNRYSREADHSHARTSATRSQGDAVSPVEESRPSTPQHVQHELLQEPVSPLTPPRPSRNSPFPFSSPETDVSDLSEGESVVGDMEDAPLPPDITRLSRIAKRSSAGDTLSPLDLRLDQLGREAFDLAYLLSPKDFPLPTSPTPSSNPTIGSLERMDSAGPASPTSPTRELPAYLGKMEDVRPAPEEDSKPARSLSRKLSKRMRGIVDSSHKRSASGISKERISKPMRPGEEKQRNSGEKRQSPVKEEEDPANRNSWDYCAAEAGSSRSLQPASQGYPTPDPSSGRSSVRSSDRNSSPETPVTPHEDYAFNEIQEQRQKPARPAPRPRGDLRPWMRDPSHNSSGSSQEITISRDGHLPEVTREPPTPEARKTRFDSCYRVETSSPLHHSPAHEVEYDTSDTPISANPDVEFPQRGSSNASSTRSAQSANTLRSSQSTPSLASATGRRRGRDRKASVASSHSGQSNLSITSSVKSSEHSHNAEGRPASRGSVSSNSSIMRSPTELHAPPAPRASRPQLSVRLSTQTTASTRVQAPFGTGPKLLRMRTMSSRADVPRRTAPEPAVPSSPAYSPSVRTFGSERPTTATSFASDAPSQDTLSLAPRAGSSSSLRPPSPKSETSNSTGASPAPSRKPSLRLARSLSTLRAPSLRRPSRRPVPPAAGAADARPATANSNRGPPLSVDTAAAAATAVPPLPAVSASASLAPQPGLLGGLEADAEAKEKAMGTIRRAFSRRAKRNPRFANGVNSAAAEDAPAVPSTPIAGPGPTSEDETGGAMGGKSAVGMDRWMLAVKAARDAAHPTTTDSNGNPTTVQTEDYEIPNIPTPENMPDDDADVGHVRGGRGPAPVRVAKLTPEERAAVARLPGTIFLKTLEHDGKEKQHRLKPKKGTLAGACVFCARGPFANMWCCLDGDCHFVCCRVCAGEKVTEGVAELF